MSKHFNKTQLKQRGWTDALIREFLGEPDLTKPNPKYKSAAPMLLYSAERVIAAEELHAFSTAQVKAETRSDASRKAATTKALELVEKAWSLPIEVKVLPPIELLTRAIADYNEYRSTDREGRYRDNFIPASADSDPVFLDRIRVNYVRHRLTKYDGAIAATFGKTGKDGAIRVLRERIYEAIAKAYPDLEQECDDQKQRREMAE